MRETKAEETIERAKIDVTLRRTVVVCIVNEVSICLRISKFNIINYYYFQRNLNVNQFMENYQLLHY